MALFQRLPQSNEPKFYVTVGLNKTLLVVGLGNIGNEYHKTRHNIGFEAVNAFAAANNFPNWTLKKDFQAELTQATISENKVIIIKPTTLMNLSGKAVQTTASFYKIPPEQIVVVHDELDVDFGYIRTRLGGGSAGHNGIKSITQQIGDNFNRIRIGIGPKHPEAIDSSDFVLQKFSKTELDQINPLTKEVNAILSEFVYSKGTLNPETRKFIF